MTEAAPSLGPTPLAASARVDPEVALPWLISLRWVAVTGQAITILISWWLLDLELPLVALGCVVAVTLATNVGLRIWLTRVPEEGARPKLLGAVLTLDTLLLTSLLALTGGPRNPFAILFVIHVALAAVALSARWAWWMVALSGVCYALIYPLHVPLRPEGVLGPHLATAGQGVALLLVAANVAFFTAGVTQALRGRESELRLAEAQLARNEWLASLAALAAGTAHELGTPLGTIAVASKELERAAAKQACLAACGEDLAGDARLIRSQVERCRRIIDRLGTLDREGLGNAPEPLDLELLLEHLREDQRGADFEIRLADDLDRDAMVHPDAAHALQPLIKNALDASADDSAPVSLEIGRGELGWRFVVRDQGPGMSKELLEQARRPFFTTKEHGRGMGLGLYLVGLIAERHGARFQLESPPSQGVTATLEFPASPQRQSSQSP